MTKALLVIDPQNDFMDSPDYQGSLAVPGAYADTKRLSAYIANQSFDAITVTMDTHSRYDISHALWWMDKDGQNPKPFTIISVADVESGKWRAYDTAEQDYSLFYVHELAKKGNYPLCIWPYHVIKGTKGHDVEENLKSVLKKWEKDNNKEVLYIYKGMNPRTEHYSALKAEVEIKGEEDTYLNQGLIEKLKGFDTIQIAGQAKSHCVAGSAMDLIDNIGYDNISKIEILEDCMSSVSGFEAQGEKFIETARKKGAKIIKVSNPNPNQKLKF